jgi:6,7-dimethyl-8-ribityllumazine synthase
MDVKDILVDILQELKGEDSDSDSEEEGPFETSDENPMFGGSEESDDEESDDEDEWEDDSDDEDDKKMNDLPEDVFN